MRRVATALLCIGLAVCCASLCREIGLAVGGGRWLTLLIPATVGGGVGGGAWGYWGYWGEG